MTKRKTQEEFLSQARAVHGSKFDYTEAVYVTNYAKIRLKCLSCQRVFDQVAASHLKGHGCMACNSSGPKNLTTEQFIAKARAVHGDLYDYSEVEYTRSSAGVRLTCTRCDRQFEQTPNNHLAGKGCRKCSRRRLRKTTAQWVAEAQEVHGDLYDYSEAEYTGADNKVRLKCNRCYLDFFPTAYNHVSNKSGCPSCSLVRGPQKTTAEFVAQARAVHGDAYDYSEVEYLGSRTRVDIGCRECGGTFSQAPVVHLRGGRCPPCKRGRPPKKTTSEFVSEALEVHSGSFDYSKTSYLGANEKLYLDCNECGNTLYRTASSHLRGTGCPHCSQGRQVSKAETEWLDHLGVPERQYQATLPSGKTTRVDGYDPETNTVYEYLGSFWHADPRVCSLNEEHTVIGKLNKDIYQGTLDRLSQLEESGYKVVFVWGYDWTRRDERCSA